MKTQVAIIGGGPAGLLLSQILHLAGIDNVVLERQSRAYVEGRIRAGVLEPGTVDMLRAAGVGERMDREGFAHDGTALAFNGEMLRLDFKELTGKSVMVYGQTEVTKDLYAVRGDAVLHEVAEVTIHDLDGDTYVTCLHEGNEIRIDCDFVAGCDGFHGVSRTYIPENKNEISTAFDFGWLGILSETPPVSHELIYAYHQDGFALASMRNESLSRYYVQVPLTDKVEDWSDDRFWSALTTRLPDNVRDQLVTGPSIEKSIVPLRSYVSNTMSYGNLFLCGDSAHIVPPTGAKGLNLAVSDVYYLSEALKAFYSGNKVGLTHYSETALRRVWQSVRFSVETTRLLHLFDGHTAFDAHLQRAAFQHLVGSKTAQKSFAENYVGLPF